MSPVKQPTTQIPPPTPIIPIKYESNPFNLIGSSIEAYKVNIRGLIFALVSLFVAIFLILGAGIATAVAIIAQGRGGAGSITDLGLAVLFGLIAIVLLFLLYAIFIQNFITVIMVAATQNQKLSIWSATKKTFRLLPRLIAADILVTLAVLGGLLLFIIPGLIFMAWFSLTRVAVVKEGLRPVAALKRSRQLVREHLTETWGLQGLQSTILGIVMLAAQPIRFTQLDALKQGQLQKVKIHWTNYLSIMIGLLYNLTFNFNTPPAEDATPNNKNIPPSLEQPVESEPASI